MSHKYHDKCEETSSCSDDSICSDSDDDYKKSHCDNIPLDDCGKTYTKANIPCDRPEFGDLLVGGELHCGERIFDTLHLPKCNSGNVQENRVLTSSKNGPYWEDTPTKVIYLVVDPCAKCDGFDHTFSTLQSAVDYLRGKRLGKTACDTAIIRVKKSQNLHFACKDVCISGISGKLIIQNYCETDGQCTGLCLVSGPLTGLVFEINETVLTVSGAISDDFLQDRCSFIGCDVLIIDDCGNSYPDTIIDYSNDTESIRLYFDKCLPANVISVMFVGKTCLPPINVNSAGLDLCITGFKFKNLSVCNTKVSLKNCASTGDVSVTSSGYLYLNKFVKTSGILFNSFSCIVANELCLYLTDFLTSDGKSEVTNLFTFSANSAISLTGNSNVTVDTAVLSACKKYINALGNGNLDINNVEFLNIGKLESDAYFYIAGTDVCIKNIVTFTTNVEIRQKLFSLNGGSLLLFDPRNETRRVEWNGTDVFWVSSKECDKKSCLKGVLEGWCFLISGNTKFLNTYEDRSASIEFIGKTFQDTFHGSSDLNLRLKIQRISIPAPRQLNFFSCVYPNAFPIFDIYGGNFKARWVEVDVGLNESLEVPSSSGFSLDESNTSLFDNCRVYSSADNQAGVGFVFNNSKSLITNDINHYPTVQKLNYGFVVLGSDITFSLGTGESLWTYCQKDSQCRSNYQIVLDELQFGFTGQCSKINFSARDKSVVNINPNVETCYKFPYNTVKLCCEDVGVLKASPVDVNNPEPDVCHNTGSLVLCRGNTSIGRPLSNSLIGSQGVKFNGTNVMYFGGPYFGIKNTDDVLGYGYGINRLNHYDKFNITTEIQSVAVTYPNMFITPGLFDTQLVSVFDDSTLVPDVNGEGEPLGVEVTATSYSKAGDNFVIFKYDVKNTSTIVRTNFHFGLFLDIDIDFEGLDTGIVNLADRIAYLSNNSITFGASPFASGGQMATVNAYPDCTGTNLNDPVNRNEMSQLLTSDGWKGFTGYNNKANGRVSVGLGPVTLEASGTNGDTKSFVFALAGAIPGNMEATMALAKTKAAAAGFIII